MPQRAEQQQEKRANNTLSLLCIIHPGTLRRSRTIWPQTNACMHAYFCIHSCLHSFVPVRRAGLIIAAFACARVYILASPAKPVTPSQAVGGRGCRLVVCALWASLYMPLVVGPVAKRSSCVGSPHTQQQQPLQLPLLFLLLSSSSGCWCRISGETIQTHTRYRDVMVVSKKSETTAAAITSSCFFFCTAQQQQQQRNPRRTTVPARTSRPFFL